MNLSDRAWSAVMLLLAAGYAVVMAWYLNAR